MTTSDGGVGKSTVEMQSMGTFVDVGWDFVTPVWWICEGNGYPKLSWEYVVPGVPVLYGEPEVTLGVRNVVSWGAVGNAKEYYVECSEDEGFSSVFSSRWIAEVSFEFSGLELGRTYWYRVKAGNGPCLESEWSGAEFSMQGTLGDAVYVLLDPDSMKNANQKNALLNKIDEVLGMIDAGRYAEALAKLENDILQKTDGCANGGEPDKNDWIRSCDEQEQVYGVVMETIEDLKSLME